MEYTGWYQNDFNIQGDLRRERVIVVEPSEVGIGRRREGWAAGARHLERLDRSVAHARLGFGRIVASERHRIC